jgi:hypothetical protein
VIKIGHWGNKKNKKTKKHHAFRIWKIFYQRKTWDNNIFQAPNLSDRPLQNESTEIFYGPSGKGTSKLEDPFKHYGIIILLTCFKLICCVDFGFVMVNVPIKVLTTVWSLIERGFHSFLSSLYINGLKKILSRNCIVLVNIISPWKKFGYNVMHLVIRLSVFWAIKDNQNYLAEILTIMRRCVEHSFKVP